MQSAKHDRKFVSLGEAISWIAFRTHLDVTGIKERLRNDSMGWSALDDAMQQLSDAAGDGRLKARGRPFAHIGKSGLPQIGDTDDIRESCFKDFQQFDLDLNRLQRLPANGRRVLGSLGIWTVAYAPDGAAQLTKGFTGTADESYARAFDGFAGAHSDDGANLGDGYIGVEVDKAGLVKAFPLPPKPSKARGRPRTLDHDAVRARAQIFREQAPDISLTSAAASLAVEFGLNRKSKKPYDHRGIERMIAPLWQSEGDK